MKKSGEDVKFYEKKKIKKINVEWKWGKIKMVYMIISKGDDIEEKKRDGMKKMNCEER
jgi:ankyrin